MDQYVLNLVGLLDLDADPYAVHTRFYEDLLILIAGYCERIEQNLWRAGCFNFWYVVAFGRL